MEMLKLHIVSRRVRGIDDADRMDRYLHMEEPSIRQSMDFAMDALFVVVETPLQLTRDVWASLSNAHKYYLVRGAYMHQEHELRDFVFQHFYSCSD